MKYIAMVVFKGVPPEHSVGIYGIYDTLPDAQLACGNLTPDWVASMDGVEKEIWTLERELSILQVVAVEES